MRNALLALVISFILGAAFYLLAVTFGLSVEIAKGLAGLPAVAVKSIYEFLEIQSAKLALQKSEPSGLVDIGDARISPWIALPIALIMYLGMSLLCSAVAGIMVAAAQNSAETPITSEKLRAFLVISAALPLRAIFSFYIGRWVGGRCERYAYVVGAVTTVLDALLYLSISFFLVDGKVFKDIYGDKGSIEIFAAAAISVMPDTILYTLIVLVGVWVGGRRRVLRYISLMLKLLPERVQMTVGEIVRDEVNRSKGVVKA